MFPHHLAHNLRAELLFSPVMSLTIGLTLAVLVAVLAIILALRIPCTASSRRRQKELSNENISRDESPGPSDKSSGSKEVDDCDEKNPDVVPESIEPDEQVILDGILVSAKIVTSLLLFRPRASGKGSRYRQLIPIAVPIEEFS